MYCVILYGVPPERFLSAPPAIPTSQKSSQRGARISDQLLYVNPDCALQILIDYIREELNIEPNDEIDFCNLNGDLLHIDESEPAINATNLFQPYMKYVCVMKHRNEEGVLAKLTPLVTNSYSEVSLKLRKHVKMSRRLSYELKLRSEKENQTEFIPSPYRSPNTKSRKARTSTIRRKKKRRRS